MSAGVAGLPPIETVAATPVPATSVADEIGKLAQLRDKGLLTDEEFAEQKRLLLMP